MNQFYTHLHFSIIHFLHFFSGTTILRYSSFILLYAVAQMLMVSDCVAQDTGKGSSIEKAIGTWIVKDADIDMLVQLEDSFELKKENCFWADHLIKGIPVEIDEAGNVSYSAFEKPAVSKVKVEEGNLIFMFFEGDAKEMGVPVEGTYSYTAYNVQFSGNRMTLSRKDGVVSEKYIFERN